MKYFEAKVIDGQLSMDRNQVRKTVRFMPEGQYLMVLIRMDNERNERDWQKFYRVILKQMSEDTGHSPTELHDIVKNEVLFEKMELTSTTQLNSVTWREYMEHLGDWAFEHFDFVM